MSETPRVDDKVRVSFEGSYGMNGFQPFVQGPDGKRIYPTPEWGAVEILERAAGPAKDPIGTVRQIPLSEHVVIKTASVDCPWRVPGQVYSGELTGYSDAVVASWPVIGAVPGTPAAGGS